MSEKKAMKKVSIALCTFNGEKYLKEQLDSILQQDYEAIDEIVCVDDCSTDSTWQILTDYSLLHPTIKIFKNTENIGYIKNFEKAIALTTNEFIALSDQDDIWHPSKVRKLIHAIKQKPMVYSDNEYVDENANPLNRFSSDFRHLAKSNNCLNFSFFNVISGHTAMINRSLFELSKPFPTDLPFDNWLAFRASLIGQVGYVNESLVRYRQHANNTLSGKAETEAERIRNTYKRLKCLAAHTPAAKFLREKKALEALAKSYHDRSFGNRQRRVGVFLKFNKEILHFRKRNKLSKFIYSFKMFWKYI
ncbi:MAG: hypothetical protein AUK44_10785 [Porphyromonadaceae bacterium CG2_30_38_12]|nr:MAG: hypothetical protein AUK44_10785 [Porphyromonadaceae bacterium CG2_30_38_12]